MDFEPVIGLEIHVQLNTQTKMFCRCRIVDSNTTANSSICPICTGQPGTLPLVNINAIRMGVKIGIALNCKINNFSLFARKNYFYPDLPKGYQISQFENPLCENGFIEIDGKILRIKRVHLEEDAGKSLHAIGSNKLDYTLVDFNRCGVPLVEIVSEPDINSAQQAYNYLVELKRLLKWIGVSNCDMEKGELRCDVNVSVREKGKNELGRKVEIKNLNSFKAVKDAITYEIERQIDLIKKSKTIEQDTRLWDANIQQTISMRSKEMVHDYRYFPEPDLIPLNISDNEVDMIRKEVGILPKDLEKKYIENYNLKKDDLNIIISNKYMSEYFIKAVNDEKDKDIIKNIIKLISTEVLAYINENKIDENELLNRCPLPKFVRELAALMSKGEVSNVGVKKIFSKMIELCKSPNILIDELGLRQTNDVSFIENIVKAAIEKNPKAFNDFKNGNEKASGPIVGYVMKNSGGKANPKIVVDILKKISN